MHRLWLLFAQTVTVGLALWFILITLKPDWAGNAVDNLRNVHVGTSPLAL